MSFVNDFKNKISLLFFVHDTIITYFCSFETFFFGSLLSFLARVLESGRGMSQDRVVQVWNFRTCCQCKVTCPNLARHCNKQADTAMHTSALSYREIRKHGLQEIVSKQSLERVSYIKKYFPYKCKIIYLRRTANLNNAILIIWKLFWVKYRCYENTI
jgi:hypothetical protein